MTETTIFNHRVSVSTAIPDSTGVVTVLKINDLLPQIVEYAGEGWKPLSHQILQVDGDILVSVMMSREVVAPDPLVFAES